MVDTPHYLLVKYLKETPREKFLNGEEMDKIGFLHYIWEHDKTLTHEDARHMIRSGVNAGILKYTELLHWKINWDKVK